MYTICCNIIYVCMKHIDILIYKYIIYQILYIKIYILLKVYMFFLKTCIF